MAAEKRRGRETPSAVTVPSVKMTGDGGTGTGEGGELGGGRARPSTREPPESRLGEGRAGAAGADIISLRQ